MPWLALAPRRSATDEVTHLAVPHELRAVSEVDPDTEPATSLFGLERDQGDGPDRRRREREQELGLDPRCAGCPAGQLPPSSAASDAQDSREVSLLLETF